jgi:Lrp/AsnC family transcriptional regulator, cysteine-sensing transcriptional activator
MLLEIFSNIYAIISYMMHSNFDKYDLKILELLQRDASLSKVEIAEAIGLSVTPCWRRINHLIKSGVVTRKVSLLDHAQVGLSNIIFAEVKLSAHGRDAVPKFEKAINEFPEVLECYLILGDLDFLLKIVTVDIHSYKKFLHTLLSLPSVSEVNSRVVVDEVKYTTELPLNQIT